MRYVVVGLGGFIGANARFLLANLAADRLGTGFPYGTMIINVTGSFLIGLILAYLSNRMEMSDVYRLLLVTGFLGAYTTFSAFTFESLTMLQNGAYGLAATYVFGSLLLGMAAVSGGYFVGRAV